MAVHFLYSVKMSWSSCVGWQLLYNWEISRLEISLISSSSKFWYELNSYWWIDYIILATLLLVFASQFSQVPSHMIQEYQVYCFLVQPTMHFSSSLTQQCEVGDSFSCGNTITFWIFSLLCKNCGFHPTHIMIFLSLFDDNQAIQRHL